MEEACSEPPVPTVTQNVQGAADSSTWRVSES